MEQNVLPDGEIFIVDDDPLVRDMLSTLFTLEGYQVESFAEGNAFLAAAHARKPACILLDVNMPGRSGIDILKELHARGYPVPVFMISGQADVPLAVSAIKSGAVDFIEKPFNVEAVVGRVRDALAAFVQQRGCRANLIGPQRQFPCALRDMRFVHGVRLPIRSFDRCPHEGSRTTGNEDCLIDGGWDKRVLDQKEHTFYSSERPFGPGRVCKPNKCILFRVGPLRSICTVWENSVQSP